MATKTEKGLRLNGTAELVTEGVRALEGLTRDPLGEPLREGACDLATLTLSENDPITAVIANDNGFEVWVWTGEEWTFDHVD